MSFKTPTLCGKGDPTAGDLRKSSHWVIPSPATPAVARRELGCCTSPSRRTPYSSRKIQEITGDRWREWRKGRIFLVIKKRSEGYHLDCLFPLRRKGTKEKGNGVKGHGGKGGDIEDKWIVFPSIVLEDMCKTTSCKRRTNLAADTNNSTDHTSGLCWDNLSHCNANEGLRSINRSNNEEHHQREIEGHICTHRSSGKRKDWYWEKHRKEETKEIQFSLKVCISGYSTNQSSDKTSKLKTMREEWCQQYLSKE